jgi:hypothetical protein
LFHASGKPFAIEARKSGCRGSSILRDLNAKPLVLPGLSATSATSYWLGGAKEMAAINPILIIVNSLGAETFQWLQMTGPAAVSRRFSVKKAANLRRKPTLR